MPNEPQGAKAPSLSVLAVAICTVHTYACTSFPVAVRVWFGALLALLGNGRTRGFPADFPQLAELFCLEFGTFFLRKSQVRYQFPRGVLFLLFVDAALPVGTECRVRGNVASTGRSKGKRSKNQVA